MIIHAIMVIITVVIYNISTKSYLDDFECFHLKDVIVIEDSKELMKNQYRQSITGLVMFTQ